MHRRFALILAACLIFAVSAAAEVLESGEYGFEVGMDRIVSAPAERVYAALTDEIGLWWDPDHTWSGDAANLFLEARAGGIFGENLPSGGSVQHLAVLYADPGRMLRLAGGLGPLQGMPVQGVMTIVLDGSKSESTILRLTYSVAGRAALGLAEPVDGVLTGQMQRLADHLAP